MPARAAVLVVLLCGCGSTHPPECDEMCAAWADCAVHLTPWAESFAECIDSLDRGRAGKYARVGKLADYCRRHTLSIPHIMCVDPNLYEPADATASEWALAGTSGAKE